MIKFKRETVYGLKPPVGDLRSEVSFLAPQVFRISTAFETTYDVVSIFPGALLGTPEDALAPPLARGAEVVAEALRIRYETAISGAMRWPWSQEASVGFFVQARML